MKGNAIMIALGKPKDDEEKSKPGMEDDDEEADIDVGEDELSAAKAMRSAKSDEDYAKALKAFIKLCEGGY